MSAPSKPADRRLVVAAGVVLQLCLGTVYAWSYFQKPVMAAFGWTNSQTAWAFSLAICFLGLAASWGGVNLPRFGPRRLALAGAALYSLGFLLGALAFAVKSLALLYLGYGVVGGIGLGLGYVTPVATAAKWYPEKRGFVTGMVVMGFGLGALLMSKLVAPVLMGAAGGALAPAFAYIGLVMLVLSLPAAAILRNPPDRPGAAVPAPGAAAAPGASAAIAEGPTARGSILSFRFARMWFMFFLNIAAGIMFVSFQSPLLQDLLRKADAAYDAMDKAAATAALAAAGATLIAASSVCNGLGRFLWGAVSDRLGRTWAFRLILASQALVFVALGFVGSPALFSVLVCYVLLCYGGGFGTMPSYVSTVFGAKVMPVVYGAILTAWSAAGIVGPQVAATIKDLAPDQAARWTFAAGAAFLAIGFALSLSLDDSPHRSRT